MNKAFKPMKSRFRATFAAGTTEEARLGNIDKENEVLHDVQITLEGEALGHGVWLDRDFCTAVAEQGNEMGDAGVKVRFGHPAMCSDALGTYIGRAKNFRVIDLTRKDGTKCCGVIADLHLDPASHEAPNGDLGKWIMTAAETSPDTFGQSIVFTYADFVVKSEDGVRHSYNEEVLGVDADGNDIIDPETSKKRETCSYEDWLNKSADGHEYAVLGHLLGTDFTDTPAATDGVFSSDSLAAEAENMLEEHPQILSVIEKHPDSVVQFLKRTGLDAKIESARLAGLQAAKDKEIAALQAKIEELSALDAAKLAEENADLQKRGVEALAAIEGELKKARDEFAALQAEHDTLKSTHDETVKALAEAKASVEQLSGDVASTKKDLAECREHLSDWQKHASAHGSDVNTPGEDVPTLKEGLAKCKTAKQRSEFIASGKYRK